MKDYFHNPKSILPRRSETSLFFDKGLLSAGLDKRRGDDHEELLSDFTIGMITRQYKTWILEDLYFIDAPDKVYKWDLQFMAMELYTADLV